MFLIGDKKECNYHSSEFKDMLYIFCILLRLCIALIFLYFLINENIIKKYYYYILGFFGFLILSFTYKYTLCGITNWKNYTKTIVIYVLVFILLFNLNKFNSRSHYLYVVISILLIFDVLFGIQTKFNSYKYNIKN